MISIIQDLANLADLVYTDSPINYKDYKYIDMHHDFFSGFYGQILQNDKTQQIVIVIRGTNNSVADYFNDGVMALGQLPNQTISADSIFKLAKPLSIINDYQLICTGHSLGGSLSQYLMYNYSIKSYAFNPYGISDCLKLSSQSAAIDQLGLNFCVVGDVVSGSSTQWQVGHDIPLSLPKDFCVQNNYYTMTRLEQFLFCHSITTVIKLLNLMKD